MEPISPRCYPSNFFDPFGDEPTHGACSECGEVYDYGDMNRVGAYFYERYVCNDCLETLKQEEE
jgi:hypothetical protein